MKQLLRSILFGLILVSRNFKSPIFLVSLYILLNTGCKKTDTQQFTPGFNVYMAGIVNHAAVVWKNGQSTELAASASATCIAVKGTDVYVGGLLNFNPVYWKNGQPNSLGQITTTVEGVALSGSDVYFVGEGNGNLVIDNAGDSIVHSGIAVYWKNGILNSLENISRLSEADGICFSGSDMYVVGRVASLADTAVQWKNGVRTNYPSDSGRTGIATAVAVSGTDVYAVGYYNNMPVYWKNGILNTLILNGSPVPNNGYASAITIVGSDIYIAGTSTPVNVNHATYWKNGVPTDLSANKSEQTIATGIAVAGTDVYVVGYYMVNGNSSPAYWKNGTEVKISGGGLINAICLGNEKM